MLCVPRVLPLLDIRGDAGGGGFGGSVDGVPHFDRVLVPGDCDCGAWLGAFLGEEVPWLEKGGAKCEGGTGGICA